MSVTAVPLRPIEKGTLAKLWIGIAVLLAVAAAFAWFTTARAVAMSGSSEDFLAWNGSRSGVVTTASGLQYQILEEGEGGEQPTATDTVLVNYVGRIPEGETFDEGEQRPIDLNQVIPGWQEALPLMSRGARFRLWVPPALGYGPNAPPDSPITPDSVMEFDIELIDFISQAQLMQMQMQQMGVGPDGTGDPGAIPPAGQ